MHLLVTNWRTELPVPWNCVLLVLTAVICGGIVGAERQSKDKPAGLRTMVLVCLGATVFAMVSFAFTSSTNDSGRVAAQVVTGIGFLGAGAILRGPLGVMGMTTAATVWAVASMGLVIGAGYAGAGLGLSTLIYIILTVIAVWENKHLAQPHRGSVIVVFDPCAGKGTVLLAQALNEFRIAYNPADVSIAENGLEHLRLRLVRTRRDHLQLLARLAAMDTVKAIRFD